MKLKDNKDSMIQKLIIHTNELSIEKCKECEHFEECSHFLLEDKSYNCIWFNRLWAACSNTDNYRR
jgi:hypothetical protein